MDSGLLEHRGKPQRSDRGNKDECTAGNHCILSYVRRIRKSLLGITGGPLGCKTKQHKAFTKAQEGLEGILKDPLIESKLCDRCCK